MRSSSQTRSAAIVVLSVTVGMALPSGPTYAQGRTLPAASSVTAYRPIGETRVWTFESRDTVVGSISSRVLDTSRFEDQPSVKVRASLSLDYRDVGSDLVIDIQSEHTVALNGRFLAESLSVTLAGLTETSRSLLTGDSIVTRFERGDQPVVRSIPIPGAGFAWDQNFLDQLELYLAMRTIREGMDIYDTIYLTQAMVSAPLEMAVGEFGWVRLFSQRFDSVFTIRISQPQPMVAYFNNKRRLVKAELLGTNTKAYLDRVQTETRPQASSEASEFNWPRLWLLLPHWAAYLLIMTGVLALLTLPSIKRTDLWLTAVIGAAAGLLIPAVQMPLQEYAIQKWLIPAVTGGGSLAVWGTIPSGVAAVFQELLKVMGIAVVIRFAPFRLSPLAAGAALGAGLGLTEVVSLSLIGGVGTVFSWTLLDRSFFLMFHAGSGLLLGYAWALRRDRLPGMLAITIVFNLVLRYIPLLVQKKTVSIEVAHLILGFLCLALITGAITLQKQPRLSNRPVQP